jgi:hypothetical protein
MSTIRTLLTSEDDMGKRYSLFYILGCVASAFAGLLAYGVCPSG